MSAVGTIIVEFDLINRKHQVIDLEDFLSLPQDPEKIYWIHCDLNDHKAFKQIENHIRLPDEVLRLCQEENTISKLLDHDLNITMKFQCILEKEFNKNREEHFGDLVMHLTKQYCFTASSQIYPSLTEFQENYEKALPFARTSCFILFLILDNVVNDYAQFLFNFEVVSDQMDFKVRSSHQNIYNEVVDVKKRVMEIKRCTVAIREILMRLSGRKISVISDECKISLVNLFNQSQMIFHEIDSIRDMLNGMLNQMDYMLMHKMNETMRVLTAFAAIFLPLTLITGIYGMNFQHMPELYWEYGYYFVLVLIVVAGFGLYYVFKKRGWF